MRALAGASEGLLDPQRKAELVDRLRTIMLPPTPRFDAYTEFLFSERFIAPKQDFRDAFLKPGRIEERSISTPVDLMLVSGTMPTLLLFEMFEERAISPSEFWSALVQEEKTCLETGFRNALVMMPSRGFPALVSALRHPVKKKWRLEFCLRPSAKSEPETRDASSSPKFVRFFTRAEAA